MNIDLTPVQKSLDPLWKQAKALFGEHHFLTILCAFFAVMMVISCYRVLKSISPALVAVICLLIVGILFLHWIATRTEPAFLTPLIDWVAPFFPVPVPAPRK
jgi:hypothetical protein